MSIRTSSSSPLPAVRRLVGIRYPWWRLLGGTLVLAAVALLAASHGSVAIPFPATARILFARLPGIALPAELPPAWDTILWQLRLPRVLLAGLVGLALAISGAAYQGLFKNPLADPYLVGVASGAGLAATIVLLDLIPGPFADVSLVPAAAFTGGLAAVAAAYAVARGAHGTPLTTLILAGVAISALTSAVGSLLIMTGDTDVRPVLSWLLGSFISATWRKSLVVTLYLTPSLGLLLGFARVLNVLRLNEEHAALLGVDLEQAKRWLIAAATLATAAAVSFTGLIGFVGLVAPHVVRLLWGDDYRFLLPMSGLVGAIFLVSADLAARTVVSPGELPVGVVTAFCGAPFFLYLLRRRRAEGR